MVSGVVNILEKFLETQNVKGTPKSKLTNSNYLSRIANDFQN